MHLTGNGAALVVLSDGSETSFQRRGAAPSQAGNQLGGTYTLTLLGHTTAPIEFNAADTEVKALLEQLPNIGTVSVVRSSPTPQLGYRWTVTFLSNPGAFPPGAGEVPSLVPGIDSLTGTNVTANVSQVVTGYPALAGTFQLTYTNGSSDRTTADLVANSDATEVAFALESLDDMVGRVSVMRSTNEDGFTWSVTFGPCQTNPLTGAAVCNDGDLSLLSPVTNGSLLGCRAAPWS